MPLFGLGSPNIKKLEAQHNVAQLIDILLHYEKDDFIRAEAAAALGRIRDELAMPALLEALHAHHALLIERTAGAIAQIAGAQIVPTLLDAVRKSDNKEFHTAVIETLRFIGKDAAEPLTTALGDSNRYVHSVAAVSLGFIGEAAVPSLIEALNNGELAVRKGVITMLKHIKINAAWIIEPLVAALNDRDEDIRRDAVKALETMLGKLDTQQRALLNETRQKLAKRQ